MDTHPQAWHSEGQGFESPRFHQFSYSKLRLSSSDRCERHWLTVYLTAYLRGQQFGRPRERCAHNYTLTHAADSPQNLSLEQAVTECMSVGAAKVRRGDHGNELPARKHMHAVTAHARHIEAALAAELFQPP